MMFKLSLMGAVLAAGLVSTLAQTAGVARLEFTTETGGPGKYAPRHVMAVWVADAQTNHVKTVLLLGKKRHSKLLTWHQVRPQTKIQVDGVTGATVTRHQAHAIEWDGTDATGRSLPDGTYYFCAEFTENHQQGPLLIVPFTKGPAAQNHSPPGQPGFPKAKVTVTPKPRP